MPKVNVKPRVFNKYALKIAADNHESAVSTVTLTPTTPGQSWTGADGVTHSATGASTWALQLDYAQDWETPGSLSLYLLNHEGETVAAEFFPLETGPKFTANIVIAPGAVGGAVGAYGTGSVTLGVDGKPVFAAAGA